MRNTIYEIRKLIVQSTRYQVQSMDSYTNGIYEDTWYMVHCTSYNTRISTRLNPPHTLPKYHWS